MDRFVEFRYLAGLSGSEDAPVELPTNFMLTAAEHKKTLTFLRKRLQYDTISTSEVVAHGEKIKELEEHLSDFEDLGWRAPNQSRDLVAHRKAVIVSLYDDLQQVVEKVEVAQVQRLQHEAEVANYFSEESEMISVDWSQMAQPSPPPAFGIGGGSVGSSSPALPVLTLPDDDGKLEAEARSILLTYMSDTEDIQTALRKAEEVTSIMNLFSQKVEQQHEQLESIFQDAKESTRHVEEAEQHLKKAVDNKSSFRYFVVCWFVGSAIFLLVLDFVRSFFRIV